MCGVFHLSLLKPNCITKWASGHWNWSLHIHSQASFPLRLFQTTWYDIILFSWNLCEVGRMNQIIKNSIWDLCNILHFQKRYSFIASGERDDFIDAYGSYTGNLLSGVVSVCQVKIQRVNSLKSSTFTRSYLHIS